MSYLCIYSGRSPLLIPVGSLPIDPCWSLPIDPCWNLPIDSLHKLHLWHPLTTRGRGLEPQLHPSKSLAPVANIRHNSPHRE